MVRGLFNSMQFPLAQFPVVELSGELLYDPLWEAVMGVENIGLKVLRNFSILYACTRLCFNFVCTGYGCNPRRKLSRQEAADSSWQFKSGVQDQEPICWSVILECFVTYSSYFCWFSDHDFFFFADLPRLMKTARNCWSSKKNGTYGYVYPLYVLGKKNYM